MFAVRRGAVAGSSATPYGAYIGGQIRDVITIRLRGRKIDLFKDCVCAGVVPGGFRDVSLRRRLRVGRIAAVPKRGWTGSQLIEIRTTHSDVKRSRRYAVDRQSELNRLRAGVVWIILIAGRRGVIAGRDYDGDSFPRSLHP